MKKTSEPSPLAQSFVERLLKLTEKKDRGRLAELRRALSPTTESQAWPALGALAGSLAFEPKLRLVYQTVGALYALHPEHQPIGNFGVTCRHLAQGREEAFERRFRRLLACETQPDLCNQIMHLAKMAKASGKAIDYARLFDDLSAFASNPKRVLVEWAREYWSAPALPESEPTPTAEMEVAP